MIDCSLLGNGQQLLNHLDQMSIAFPQSVSEEKLKSCYIKSQIECIQALPSSSMLTPACIITALSMRDFNTSPDSILKLYPTGYGLSGGAGNDLSSKTVSFPATDSLDLHRKSIRTNVLLKGKSESSSSSHHSKGSNDNVERYLKSKKYIAPLSEYVNKKKIEYFKNKESYADRALKTKDT